MLARYNATVQGQFFGHVHTDQFTITQACRTVNSTSYVETTGIKWCSGGGDYAPGNVFGAGLDGLCPITPTAWSTSDAVAACERVCSANDTCVGFTMYFHPNHNPNPNSNPNPNPNSNPTTTTSCCFRTGSTANKPPDPTSTARCYEKPGGTACDGAPTGVLIPGPSLTEGYPATNPSVRLLEFDPSTYALVDMLTYTADLHQANVHGTLNWTLEYSTRDTFKMPDLSPEGFNTFVATLASNDSVVWNEYVIVCVTECVACHHFFFYGAWAIVRPSVLTLCGVCNGFC